MWKTNVNVTDREDQVTGGVTPKCLKACMGETIKG